MSEASKAVFLSYASQDAAAAERIAEALRAAGIEVWFDKSELVGGDAWDQKIRDQIASCTLFLPVISANTQARTEGYFRLEWRLAEQRTHLMAKGRPFLVPIVIDDTQDSEAHVPDAFFDVQWSRFPAGECDEGFPAHIEKLLRWDGSQTTSSRASAASAKPAKASRSPRRPAIWPWVVISALSVLFFTVVWPRLGSSGTDSTQPTLNPDASSPALTEADKLTGRARALLDDDPLMTRRNVELAEQLALQAVEADPTHAEAAAAVAWANFQFIWKKYEDTPERRANLRRFAESALLLDPDSAHAELASCGVLLVTQKYDAARHRLKQLADRFPGNFTVLHTLARISDDRTLLEFSATGTAEDHPVARLRAHSPRGQVIADTILASHYWEKSRFAEAELLLDPIFENGSPENRTYLNRLLILLYGWGDLDRARQFVETIPDKLLLEDVFIKHVYSMWMGLGDYNRALATLDRTQQEVLQEAVIRSPTAAFRGNALAAAGRTHDAHIQWRMALKLVESQLEADPRDFNFRIQRMELLARLGDLETVRREYDLVLESWGTPEAGTLQWAYAWPYFMRTGDFDEAALRFDRLISRDHHRWASAANSTRHDPEFAEFCQHPQVQAALARADRWLVEMREGHLPTENTSELEPPQANSVAANSIAVLAFENRSTDADNEYFSDGISEELMNVLTKVEGLKVTARTSAFYFKGKNTPIPEIGRQLGVAYIVEGSVRKAGDRVRITTQLIKADDGFNVWSQSFDRELKDIFALQDEIAGLVASELQLKLGITSEHREVNPEAYGLYLEARHLWNQRGEDNFIRAETALNRALELDPDFAEAHATMADIWAMRATYWSYEGKADIREEIAKTRASANHAISLNPDLSRPYSALGWACMLEGKWEESLRWHRQAVERSPQDAMTRFWYGSLLHQIGQISESEKELFLAAELDPLSFIITLNLGFFPYIKQDWEESYSYYRKGAELREGGFIPAQAGMAHSAYRLGRTEEAVRLSREVLASWPELPRFSADQFAVWVLHQTGHETEAEAFVDRVLPEIPPRSYMRGFLLAGVGRWEEALPNFETTPYSARGWVFDSPILDPWRGDPRFLAMLERWGETERYQNFRNNMLKYRNE